MVAGWRFNVDISVTSPAISHDDVTIYAGSDDHNLYAINRNGSLQWSFSTESWISGSPVIGADGTIYVPSADNNLYALNPDGSLQWLFDAGHIVSTPALGADGTVYIESADCILFAIDPTSGTDIWQLLLDDGDCGLHTSPVIGADGTIYARRNGSFSDDALYAVEPDGQVKWIADPPQEFDTLGMPAIAADGTIIIQGIDLYGYDPDDGDLLWIYPADNVAVSLWDYYSPAIGPDNIAYIVGAGWISAIDIDDGTLLWRTFLGQATAIIASTATLGADGIIYVGSPDDNLYAIKAQDGAVLWTYTTGLDVLSSPALGKDGTVYIRSHDGYLYAIQTSSLGLIDSSWPKFRQNSSNTGLAQ